MTQSPINQSSVANRVRTACLAGLLVAGGVSAHGVTFVSDNRSASVSAHAPNAHASAPNTSVLDTPAIYFVDRHLTASGSVCWQDMNGWSPAPTTGTARQDATFTPNQISVTSSLSVSAGGDPYGNHCSPGASGSVTANSLFEIQFSVDTATLYNYMFNFDPSATLTAANLSLISANHGSQQLFRTSGAYASGLLAPDTYTLRFVFGSSAVGAQSGYNTGSAVFNFTPAPVPEPTAFALVGMGMVALGIYGRRGFKKQ